MPEQGNPQLPTVEDATVLSVNSVVGGASPKPMVPGIDADTGEVIDANGHRISAVHLDELAGQLADGVADVEAARDQAASLLNGVRDWTAPDAVADGVGATARASILSMIGVEGVAAPADLDVIRVANGVLVNDVPTWQVRTRVPGQTPLWAGYETTVDPGPGPVVVTLQSAGTPRLTAVVDFYAALAPGARVDGTVGVDVARVFDESLDLRGAREAARRAALEARVDGLDRGGPTELWLAIGQSNTEQGHGAHSVDVVLPEGALQVWDGAQAVDVVQASGSPLDGTMWVEYARRRHARTGATTLVVPEAIGATALVPAADSGNGYWGEGPDTLYDAAVASAQAARAWLDAQGRLYALAVYWGQGERDAASYHQGTITLTANQAELAALMTRLRATFEEDLPVYIGRLGRRGGNGVADDVLDAAMDAVAGVQEAVAASEPNVVVVARGTRLFREKGRMVSANATELHYGLGGVTYLGEVLEAVTAGAAPTGAPSVVAVTDEATALAASASSPNVLYAVV